MGIAGSGSEVAVGGGGKIVFRKSLAFSSNVFAVTSWSVMSRVGSVLLGLVYCMAVKTSLPRAPWRKSFQFFDFASWTALKKQFLTAANWFHAGMVRSAFHSQSLVFIILRFWLISSVHHGLERTVVIFLGTCIAADICMIMVS